MKIAIFSAAIVAASLVASGVFAGDHPYDQRSGHSGNTPISSASAGTGASSARSSGASEQKLASGYAGENIANSALWGVGG